MRLKTVKKTTLLACVLLAVMALAGCKNKQDAGGLSSKSTPAEVNKAVQEQAAKRAAYYKNQSSARR